jgi:hypothetical protein
LASLLNDNLLAAPAEQLGPLRLRPAHFAPKAKRVIYLFMAGAPSHLDLFDYKPKLVELNGKPVPESLIAGQRFAFLKGVPNLLGPLFPFNRHGKSGTMISSLLPHLGRVADDITVIRSMHTDAFNHDPAVTFLNTGATLPGRPTLGAWLTYGLGSESRDLPAFVVLVSGGGDNQPLSEHYWGSGFLPGVYQGVRFRGQGDPVLSVSNPAGISSRVRRQGLDALRDLNQLQFDAVGDPEIQTRIASFEMAYRMQSSVPELMDISSEPVTVHEHYGTEPGKMSFANNCLLARRLVERGTRFVQLFHRGWDHHGGGGGQNLVGGLPKRCGEIDRPAAALIEDLKRRGLLDETLVIWGGEFGRTPMLQGKVSREIAGRDHHPRAFSIWMAGGGIQSGRNYGASDELGYNTVDDPVHVHDFQATILHCMGLDHTRLTYKFQGREFRLTDIAGNVIHPLLT